MSSNDNEDPTVPGGQFPEDGAEDRTVPAGKVPSDGPSEDPTVPGGSFPEDAAEDRTVPSGKQPEPASGSEDRTVPAMGEKGAKSDDVAKSAAVAPGELLGKTIGGCRIDKLLGRGAMGAVYKARQLKLDRDVAVKVIRPEMMTDPRMLKRFEVEARTVGKFNSANVVMVHDVGFELGVHYLVMEFVKGKNLREHVKLLAGGRLPAGEALPLIRQACKGLEEARRLGVVHRDIKPDNLMLTDQDILKIADFGIAKPQEDFSMTLTSELIGTPLYMSPEQCQGGADVDFRSDMYSLGATFFYLLTGEPPIRASSVYELIQTKTKLENLCLWKSLPELDENNPLSRVIERMTANDRDDRYESYEELLNDLVLVEAGETITVRAKKLKKAIRDRESERDEKNDPVKPKSPVLMIVLLLVIVGGGGGGYWWWSQQPKKIEQVDNPQKPVKPLEPDLQEARTALQGLRTRFGNDGPSSALRTDVANLDVPALLVDEKTRLQTDVDTGLKIDAALKELQPPQPKVPFDQLEPFFAEVEKAAAVEASAGAELRTWAEARAKEARAEDSVGPTAITELRDELNKWREDRTSAEGDDVALAALGDRLNTIRECRTTLYDLLPNHRDDLNKYIETATLDKLQLGLASTPVGPTGGGDISKRLDEIRTKFENEGPDQAEILRAQDLTAPTSEDLAAKDKLINEMRRVQNCVTLAEGTNTIYPTNPQPPEFVGVENFLTAIDNALKPVQVDGKLPEWAEAKRKELRREDTLRVRVAQALTGLWNTWDGKRAGGALADELLRGKTEIERALLRAGMLFPDAKAELAAAVPTATLEAAMAEVNEGARVATWQASLTAAKQQLSGIRSLTEWDVIATEMAASQKSLRESLAKLGDQPKLTTELDLFDETCDKWGKAKTDLLKAANALAAGSLTRCLTSLRSSLAPSNARAEFDDLKELAERCQSAFAMAKTDLNVSEALAELKACREVARKMKLLPNGVAARIDTWQAGIGRLDRAAKVMVKIPAGVSKNPRGDVKAFFMSPTECSVGEFKAFVAEVKAAAKGADPEARFQAVADRFQDSGMTAAKLATMLKRSRGSDDDKPVSASFYEATAYCAWRGVSLPTREEWSLAALGDGGLRKFPWGDSMSGKMQDRNTGRSAVNVDSGGRSLRTDNGRVLHHLAGNMSEWLQPPSDAKVTKSDCVGGSYADTGGSAADYFSGKRVRAESRNRPPSHVGFRVVLRPAEFRDATWPQ